MHHLPSHCPSPYCTTHSAETRGPSCCPLDLSSSSHFRALHMQIGLFSLPDCRIMLRGHYNWELLPAFHIPFTSYFDICLLSLALTGRYIYAYIKYIFCICVCKNMAQEVLHDNLMKEKNGIIGPVEVSTDAKPLKLRECYFPFLIHPSWHIGVSF